MGHVGHACLIVAALVVACGRSDGSPPRPLDGAHVRLLGRSSPLPVSKRNDLAAMTADYACTFDSYELQIVCAARGGKDVARFGREGGSPGELRRSGTLVSGPGETVGFVDTRNKRVSLFSRAGYVGELPRPGTLSPAAELSEDSTFTGHGFPALSGPPVLTVSNVDLGRSPDHVNWEVRLEFDPRELESSDVPVSHRPSRQRRSASGDAGVESRDRG